MKKCSNCGAPLESTAISNGETTQITVPTHLIPIITDGLGITRNTAMMSGSDDGRIAVEALRKELDLMRPTASRSFTRYQWFRLCQRVLDGADIDFEIKSEGRSWNRTYRVHAIDRSGEPWGQGYRAEAPLCSEPFDKESDAEGLLSAVKDEIQRFRPLS